MAVLSQFGFGGGIKSIQRGSTTLTGNSDTVTISSVNTAKSIVIATYRSGRTKEDTTNYAVSASAVLTNSTTLTVYRGRASPNVDNPTLDWQVVEFF